MSVFPSELRPASPAPQRSSRGRRLLSTVIVVCALLLAALVAFHTAVPDVLGAGLLIDSVAPWLGLGVPVLVLLALAARRALPTVAVLVPLVAWCLVFGPVAVPLEWSAPPPSDKTLTVASQNVEADSGTGAESAKALAATGADAIAVQEMDETNRTQIDGVLSADYEYSYGIGTVGLWSRYPIVNAQPWDLGLGWQRALAADLETPDGPVSIYVIHAASARPDDHAERDEMLTNLAGVLPHDENNRVIAIGDFNAASTDRSFAAVTDRLPEPNLTGGLFGFTWPSHPFAVARLDHFLQRGMEVTSNRVFRAGSSDHLAIVASMNL